MESDEMIELRADPDELAHMREFVGDWARRCRLSPEDSFRASLVATEAVTNAIRHGKGRDDPDRPISVRCALHGDALVVDVTDRGSFRTRRADAEDHGGRGLFLIRELTRGFDLHAGDDGTRLSMRLGAHGPPVATGGARA